MTDTPDTVPVEIVSRWDSTKVLFRCEVDAKIPVIGRIKAALEIAVRDGASLVGARLDGARLDGASLVGASLVGASLDGARLDGASLVGASLDGARLDGASLVGARLDVASLVGASLDHFKQDMIAEILRMPDELEALRAAITEGRIDGSTYSGDCACLAGTLAKARGLDDYNGTDIINGLTFHAASSSPRENWFTMIRPGQTPETHIAAKLALDWTNEAIAIRDNIRQGMKV